MRTDNERHRKALVRAVKNMKPENTQFLLGDGAAGINQGYRSYGSGRTTLLNRVVSWEFPFPDERMKQKVLATMSMRIDRGADVTDMERKRRTLLIAVVPNDSGLDLARVLLDRGADPLAEAFRVPECARVGD